MSVLPATPAGVNRQLTRGNWTIQAVYVRKTNMEARSRNH